MARENCEKRHLTEPTLAKVAGLFKVLSEPMRLRLLYSLTDGEKNVSQLVKETGALQANVSKHLGMLLEAGIVARRKKGQSAFYRIIDESIFELCELACGSIYDRLEAELQRLSEERSREEEG